MLSAEDIKTIRQMIHEEGDDSYVKKDDCNTRHENLTKDLTSIAVSMAKTESKLSLLIKISTAVATAVGLEVVGAVMNLILGNK